MSRNLTLFFSTELFFITTLHGPRRKHSLSVVGKACLQCCCIATEVIQLLLACSLPWNVFTKLLHSNEHLFWLHYSSFRASCHSIILSALKGWACDSGKRGNWKREGRDGRGGMVVMFLLMWLCFKLSWIYDSLYQQMCYSFLVFVYWCLYVHIYIEIWERRLQISFYCYLNRHAIHFFFILGGIQDTKTFCWTKTGSRQRTEVEWIW
jgi:hypothetical protein